MLSRERAEQLIRPYAPRIYECVAAGVADYQKKYLARLKKIHHSRTRACIVRDHIVERIAATFQGVEGTHTGEYRGLFFLAIGEEAALRFNKLDEDFSFHNNSTQQSLAFVNQEPIPEQISFSTIPPHATQLVAGYIPNPAFTAASSVFVTCPEGDCSLWQIDLAPAVAPVISIDEHRTREQTDVRKSQVIANPEFEQAAKKDEADDDGQP